MDKCDQTEDDFLPKVNLFFLIFQTTPDIISPEATKVYSRTNWAANPVRNSHKGAYLIPLTLYRLTSPIICIAYTSRFRNGVITAKGSEKEDRIEVIVEA